MPTKLTVMTIDVRAIPKKIARQMPVKSAYSERNSDMVGYVVVGNIAYDALEKGSAPMTMFYDAQHGDVFLMRGLSEQLGPRLYLV